MEPVTRAPELTLDHVGALAHDLATAAQRWERLGFTLSPVSRQRGAVPGEEGVHPWATANRCAVFRRGYLELIGVVDAGGFNPWQRFLERFEGLHLLALRCADAGEAYEALKDRAPFLAPPVERERKLTYRGEERTMRFRNVFSRDDACPEARYIVIEHQTPELLWQPELMRHENGAAGLVGATLVTDDPAVRKRSEALGGIVDIEHPDDFVHRHGWRPQAPALAGITVAFDDVEAAVRTMQARGVDVRRHAGETWLPPVETNGFVMRLVQHD
jgi:hypothetical protein